MDIQSNRITDVQAVDGSTTIRMTPSVRSSLTRILEYLRADTPVRQEVITVRGWLENSRGVARDRVLRATAPSAKK